MGEDDLDELGYPRRTYMGSTDGDGCGGCLVMIFIVLFIWPLITRFLIWVWSF